MSNYIFEIENKRKREIDKFNKLHKEDLKRNYFVIEEKKTKESLKQKSIIAKKINKNFESLTEKEIINLSNLCTNIKTHLSRILEFELKYFIPKKCNMSLKEFKKRALYILNRYQSKAGGKRIEDLDWTIYTSKSKEEGRIVMNNELLFENSICKCDLNDFETNKFLKNIVRRLNLLTDDVDVELRFNEEKSIVWVWIWCVHNKLDLTPKIGL